MKTKKVVHDGFNIAAAAAEIMDIMLLEDFLKTHDYTNLTDDEQNELIELYKKANLSDEEKHVLHTAYKKRVKMTNKPTSGFSREITDRFIFAIDALVSLKLLKSRRFFCINSGYTEAAFSRIVHDKEKIISLWVLYFLCTHYPVNADWLLTGRGHWALKTAETRKK